MAGKARFLTAFQLIQAAAITVVFVRGAIFTRVRTHGPALWRELVTCALCAGWWIGATIGVLAPLSHLFRAVLDVVGAGAITGCGALLFVRLLELLEEHSGDP